MRLKARGSGFSIIELMVALAILAFGIYGAADLIRSSHHTAALADARLSGSSLGQLKLAEIGGAPENLTAAMKALKPEPDGSILFPADGPAPFEQNKNFVWRASFNPSPDNASRISAEIIVSRNEDGKAGEQVYVTKGDIFVRPGNKAS